MKKRCYFLILIVSILLYTLVFSWLSYLRFLSFYSDEHSDQAEQMQMVRNTAKGLFFMETINSTSLTSEGSPLASGHIRPTAIILSVFYLLCDNPISYYVAVSFFLAFAAIPLFFIAKDVLKNETHAFMIAISYLLFAPLHLVNFSDGDSIILCPLFFLFSFLYLNRNNYIKSFIFAIIFMMTKEDMSFMMIMMGIYILCKKQALRWSLVFIIVGSIYFKVSAYIVNNYGNIVYTSQMGTTFLGNLKEALQLPLCLLHKDTIITQNLLFLLKLLKLIFFLPLFSPQFYISLPSIFEVILSSGSMPLEHIYYIAPIISCIFLSCIFLIKKLNIKIFGLNLRLIALTLILLLSFLSNFGNNFFYCRPSGALIYRNMLDAKNIFDKRFYIQTPEDKMAWQFINLIPKYASVAASSDMLLPLTSRKYLYEIGYHHSEKLELVCKELVQSSPDFILLHNKYVFTHILEFNSELVESYNNKLVHKLLDMGRWGIYKKQGSFILLKLI